VSELDRSFRVELCGIQEKDKNILKRILAITTSRTRSYNLIDAEENEFADILIVNADDADAKQKCDSKYSNSNGKNNYAMILASRNKIVDSQHSTTMLPFFPTRVLKCLDEVTVKDLKFTPELRIEETEQKSENSTNINEYRTELTSDELESFIGQRPSIKTEQKKPNVLVVDDSLPVRKALDLKLRLLDYEIQHAASGREALWLIQKIHFDFIFLDVVMPGIDGYEVCKQIKRNKPTKHIPVIMLTSKSSPFDKVKGKLAGCDSYLTKPVEHDKFEKVISEILA